MTPFTNIPKEVEEVLEKWTGTTSRRNFLKSSGLFVVHAANVARCHQTPTGYTAAHPDLTSRQLIAALLPRPLGVETLSSG